MRIPANLVELVFVDNSAPSWIECRKGLTDSIPVNGVAVVAVAVAAFFAVALHGQLSFDGFENVR